jgi:capsule biosynthesis phosphatase
MNSLIIDLDGTITEFKKEGQEYEDLEPNSSVVKMMRDYKSAGYRIVIHTARNMRTFDGQVDLIMIHTLPAIERWLKKHSIPFDDIVVGKPWCGPEGIYVDDRAVRPDEFVSMGRQEIIRFLRAKSQ